MQITHFQNWNYPLWPVHVTGFALDSWCKPKKKSPNTHDRMKQVKELTVW